MKILKSLEMAIIKEIKDFMIEVNCRLWALENPPRFQYGDRVRYHYSFMGGSVDYEGIYKGEATVSSQCRNCYVDTGGGIKICEEENLTKID